METVNFTEVSNKLLEKGFVLLNTSYSADTGMYSAEYSIDNDFTNILHGKTTKEFNEKIEKLPKKTW